MTELERKAMYKMLVEIKRIAANASMTGALEDGAPTLVTMYNKCLAALIKKGDTIVAELFTELSPDKANVDEVGVAAALLASYLQPEGVKRRGLSSHDIIAFQSGHKCCGQDYDDEEDDD